MPYVSLSDATQMWCDLVAPRLQVAAGGEAIEDSLQVIELQVDSR